MGIKDVIAEAKHIILAPISNILCVVGVLLLLASFVNYDKLHGFALHGNPHIVMIIVGCLLVVLGVAIYLLLQKEGRLHTSLNYDKGVVVRRGEFVIVIKTAEIQKISDTTKNSAIVLPANTMFTDDCVTDKRSALGAFFMEHFPEEVVSLPKIFKSLLEVTGHKVNNDGQYKPGTTILLPDNFHKPAKILVTASTTKVEGVGITSNPYIICSCVESIFKSTADQRVDTVFTPVLGSGHGGIDKGMALLFLLLATLHFSKSYHHIKIVNVVVHPKDIESLNRSKELKLIVAL